MKKAYAVSNLKFLPEQNASGTPGNYLPTALIDFINAQCRMKANKSEKYTYDAFYEWGYLRTINNKSSIFNEYFIGQAKAHPIMYLPQSVGMALGNGIFFLSGKISPLDLMIFGRLFNLLFFVVMGYLAIKLIPFMKHTLFLILTLPMTLTLASSLSYDVITISTCTLTASLLLHYAYDNKILKISRMHIIILCICAIVLIECKQVYYLILMLFMVIPTERFQSLKQKVLFFLIVVFSGIATHAIWMLIVEINYPITVPETINQSFGLKQVEFIIQNPFKYILILFSTFRQLNGFYISSFIGILGSLDTSFPCAFIVIMFLSILVTTFADTGSYEIKAGTRLLSFTVFMAIVFLIETAIYVTWTSLPGIGSVGAPIIEGVQGRYFIPIAILLLTSLSLPVIKNGVIESIREKIIGMTPLISLSASSITVFILIFRYYI